MSDAAQGEGWWQGTNGSWYPPELYPSDVPKGDGWWQASDGKWYPPEFHPNYTPRQAFSQAPETPHSEMDVTASGANAAVANAVANGSDVASQTLDASTGVHREMLVDSVTTSAERSDESPQGVDESLESPPVASGDSGAPLDQQEQLASIASMEQKQQVIQALMNANSKYAKPFEKGNMAAVSGFEGNWESYAEIVLTMVTADTLLKIQAELETLNRNIETLITKLPPQSLGPAMTVPS